MRFLDEIIQLIGYFQHNTTSLISKLTFKKKLQTESATTIRVDLDYGVTQIAIMGYLKNMLSFA